MEVYQNISRPGLPDQMSEIINCNGCGGHFRRGKHELERHQCELCLAWDRVYRGTMAASKAFGQIPRPVADDGQRAAPQEARRHYRSVDRGR